jgi:Zn-dependent peptidase ImmA (M78 family)
MEWQAAYAGGALLMPATALKDYVTGGNRGGDLIAEVAQQFDVSTDAAAARLTQLGFLTGSVDNSPPVKDSVNYSE